ncbi:MAG TPA: cysteine synthase A [Firmicutes bacterium]|jgi:cysteine synthase A|nr:cysteine synthase A [Bacillota bacterium]HCT35854.1 cysteine synthase A [Bacillota bacterium]
MLYDSILDCIGNTPLVLLKRSAGVRIYGKAEFLNPGGSIKDRVARYMLEEAERRGELRPGMTIVEPTSGNTGIGLTLAGRRMGYRVMIVMPENMSEERKKIIKAFGGKLVLTPAEESIEGCLRRVEAIRAENPNVYVPQQFENKDNPQAHYLTTGPEIWRDLNGKVDVFVSGMGSGGTLAGVGRYLKEQNPNVRIVAVEPKNVSALLGHEPGFHKIQGIGDGFIPSVLDPAIVDQVIEVTDDDAIESARFLASEIGLLVGTSAGANFWGSCQIAKTAEKVATIVTVLPDRAERYFSTALI